MFMPALRVDIHESNNISLTDLNNVLNTSITQKSLAGSEGDVPSLQNQDSKAVP